MVDVSGESVISTNEKLTDNGSLSGRANIASHVEMYCVFFYDRLMVDYNDVVIDHLLTLKHNKSVCWNYGINISVSCRYINPIVAYTISSVK